MNINDFITELQKVTPELDRIQKFSEALKEATTLTDKAISAIGKIELMKNKKALTMEEAAMFTGLKVKTLYQMTCKNTIPYYKCENGKTNYFDKDELTKWMLAFRKKTRSEIESIAADYLVDIKIKSKKNIV